MQRSSTYYVFQALSEPAAMQENEEGDTNKLGYEKVFWRKNADGEEVQMLVRPWTRLNPRNLQKFCQEQDSIYFSNRNWSFNIEKRLSCPISCSRQSKNIDIPSWYIVSNVESECINILRQQACIKVWRQLHIDIGICVISIRCGSSFHMWKLTRHMGNLLDVAGQSKWVKNAKRKQRRDKKMQFLLVWRKLQN